MADIRSSKVLVQAPASKVYERLSNPQALISLIDNIPADKLPADKMEMLKKVEITPDSITLPGGPTGPVTLRLADCVEPTLIRLKASDLPISLALELHLSEVSEHTCLAECAVDADIPKMLMPMVKGPLQKVADQVAHLLEQIPFA